jgi:hypothetical protein
MALSFGESQFGQHLSADANLVFELGSRVIRINNLADPRCFSSS